MNDPQPTRTFTGRIWPFCTTVMPLGSTGERAAALTTVTVASANLNTAFARSAMRRWASSSVKPPTGMVPRAEMVTLPS